MDIYARNRPLIEEIVGKIDDFRVNVEMVYEDSYWKNWVDGGGLNYRLRFNTKNYKEFPRSVCICLAFHEMLTHFVNAMCWRQVMINEQMPQHFGMTTVHGPESFLMEGMAQTLSQFIDSADVKCSIVMLREQMSLYRFLIDNNAQIMLNEGSSIEECVNYKIEYLPYKNAEEEAHDLKSWVNNPQFRAYEFVYPMSYYSFIQIGRTLNAEEKKDFIRYIYRNWLLPHDIKQKFPNLLLNTL